MDRGLEQYLRPRREDVAVGRRDVALDAEGPLLELQRNAYGVHSTQLAEIRCEELAIPDVDDTVVAFRPPEADGNLLAALTVELDQVGEMRLREVAGMRHGGAD